MPRDVAVLYQLSQIQERITSKTAEVAMRLTLTGAADDLIAEHACV